jgi:hypothetical protein
MDPPLSRDQAVLSSIILVSLFGCQKMYGLHPTSESFFFFPLSYYFAVSLPYKNGDYGTKVESE